MENFAPSVNAEDIAKEFERAPAVYAYLSEVYVNAFNVYNREKILFEAEESRLRMLLREELTEQAKLEFDMLRGQCRTATEKGAIRLVKPSIDEINDVLRTTPAYLNGKLRLLSLEVEMKQARTLADAAKFKKDMLTNIGHHQNAQMRHLTPPSRAVSDMIAPFMPPKNG